MVLKVKGKIKELRSSCNTEINLLTRKVTINVKRNTRIRDPSVVASGLIWYKTPYSLDKDFATKRRG